VPFLQLNAVSKPATLAASTVMRFVFAADAIGQGGVAGLTGG
jgi:hypothetical protein